MFSRIRRAGILPLIFSASLASAPGAAPGWSSSEAQVQAIFDRNCIKCHGPLEHKSDMELDSREGLLRGNADGAVIVPGKPAASKLIAALAPDADPHMPPHKQLSEPDIATLRAWVAALPASATAKNARTTPARSLDMKKVPADPKAAIDYLLAASWKRDGVTPARACDDRTFVRRIYLDLAGRIPTEAESQAFLSDNQPEKRSRRTPIRTCPRTNN